MLFYLASDVKRVYLCSVILKTIFLPKKKLIPIENWKRDFVKSSVFFMSIPKCYCIFVHTRMDIVIF